MQGGAVLAGLLPLARTAAIAWDTRARLAAARPSDRRRFAAALLPRLFGNNVPGHTTRAPPVGFELATNSIQFYAIAYKTSETLMSWSC